MRYKRIHLSKRSFAHFLAYPCTFRADGLGRNKSISENTKGIMSAHLSWVSQRVIDHQGTPSSLDAGWDFRQGPTNKLLLRTHSWTRWVVTKSNVQRSMASTWQAMHNLSHAGKNLGSTVKQDLILSPIQEQPPGTWPHHWRSAPTMYSNLYMSICRTVYTF